MISPRSIIVSSTNHGNGSAPTLEAAPSMIGTSSGTGPRTVDVDGGDGSTSAGLGAVAVPFAVAECAEEGAVLVCLTKRGPTFRGRGSVPPGAPAAAPEPAPTPPVADGGAATFVAGGVSAAGH